jgi:uncharacterized oligopeptide transporter (OPT) family protein
VVSVPSGDHPSIFEPRVLVLAIALALLGAVIGLELLTRVGITPNSSIIGAIVAMSVARLPWAGAGGFRDIRRQNLLQTVISGATFGGANALLLPLGVIWLIGRPDLVPVMLVGALLGLLVDASMLYRLFDSRVFPASGAWPSGVATAAVLEAGDQGGRRARLLAAGGGAGAFGQLFGIPMDVAGVCWIGNVWALTMFGVGLLARAYAPALTGIDLNEAYVPHGVMIGAGVVALAQILRVVGARRGARDRSVGHGSSLRATIAGGFGAFVLAASALALLSGVGAQMTLPALLGFVLFAAVAALASELVVGIAAMHAGWFPAFATALIFLVLGLQLGFPPVPLSLLVGFTAATGPAFADMGYDLKAGWILRGRGVDGAAERSGRRAQLSAEVLGFAVAAVFVLLTYRHYFSADLFPPVDRVYVATIQAGADPSLLRALLIWAVPGAVLQWLGGASRQIGVLFATGLLILNPVAGWTALVALGVRVALVRRYGRGVDRSMYVLAGGFIAGSALASFGRGAVRSR